MRINSNSGSYDAELTDCEAMLSLEQWLCSCSKCQSGAQANRRAIVGVRWNVSRQNSSAVAGFGSTRDIQWL